MIFILRVDRTNFALRGLKVKWNFFSFLGPYFDFFQKNLTCVSCTSTGRKVESCKFSLFFVELYLNHLKTCLNTDL